LSEYRQKKYDNSKILNRVSSLVDDYTVPHFSVVRTSNMKKLINFIPLENKLCPNRSFSDEYLISLMYLANGKIGKTKDLLLIRIGHDYSWTQNKKSVCELRKHKENLKSIDYTINAFLEMITNRETDLIKSKIKTKLINFFNYNNLYVAYSNQNKNLFNKFKDILMSNFKLYYNLKLFFQIKSYRKKYDKEKILLLLNIKDIFENKKYSIKSN